MRNGEFVASELEEIMDDEELTESALDEVLAYGANRKFWIFFCAGVAHTKNIRDALRERKVTSEMVTGKTPAKERENIITRFRNGEIRSIVNCQVLTTGFDVPAIDLLVMLRPTKSPGLYVQICGRGMRKSDETGKTDCLVLDFAGNVLRHGPVDEIKPWKPREEGDEEKALTKQCFNCESSVPIPARICPECDFEFPVEERERSKHSCTSSDAAIMSSQIDRSQFIKFYDVSEVAYSRHQKQGKPDSMRVDYYCDGHMLPFVSEWVCFEHHGYPRRKAETWWAQRDLNICKLPSSFSQPKGLPPPPHTVDEALLYVGVFPVPAKLKIDAYGKFSEIIDVVWHDETRKGTCDPGSYRGDNHNRTDADRQSMHSM